MEPIQSIAEIPFHHRDPVELLGLVEGRDEIDRTFYGYGYSRIESLCLHSSDQLDPIIVSDVLVLALHSADEGEALSDDIELEFFIDEVIIFDENGEEVDYSVTVLLTTFLDKWLPRVAGGEKAIVLAACNPHHATIARPAIAARTPVYYATGDLVASMENIDGRRIFDLSAEHWHLAG